MLDDLSACWTTPERSVVDQVTRLSAALADPQAMATGQASGEELAEDEYIEIPSCVESLINSANQLRNLAIQADQYYGKLFLCYGHACEMSWKNAPMADLGPGPPGAAASGTNERKVAGSLLRGRVVAKANGLDAMAKDQFVLNRLHSTLKLLPLLHEFGSFIEGCLTAIGTTVRRITYYLSNCNLNLQDSRLNEDSFQLTPDVRLDTIFIALMDIMFALVRLDKILTEHTNIKANLNLFLTICKLADDPQGSELLNLPGGAEMNKLIDYINNIMLTLDGNQNTLDGTNFLQQCVKHVQHLHLNLARDRTGPGFRRFAQIFEDYLIFFAEHLTDVSAQSFDNDRTKTAQVVMSILVNMNLAPGIYMNSCPRRIFGLVCLYIIYDSLFKETDRRLLKALNQAIQRTRTNIIPLGESNCYISLEPFLRAMAPKRSIESRTYDQLSGGREAQLVLDIDAEFERLLMKTTPWLVNLESEAFDFAHGKLENWPRKQIVLIDRGLRLAAEISAAMRSIDLNHSHHGRPLATNKLILMFRLAALLKAIDCAYERQAAFVSTCLIKIERLVRSRWRRTMTKLRRRQISVKYSERRVSLSTLSLLTSICSRPEMIKGPRGRDLQSICLSMLYSSLDREELEDLSLSLDLLRLDFHDRLAEATRCGILYGHLSTLGAYYRYTFEEFPSAIEEMHCFHRALLDLADLFHASRNGPACSLANVDWIRERADGMLNEMKAELVDQFRGDFVLRLCQEFEVELRLQTHRDLYNEEHNNPFRRHLYNFRQLVKQTGHPIRFMIFNQIIDLNSMIVKHLNKICYNLTSIAPHDWFTYDSMMNLARHKYNFSFVDGQLPAQTLDSGLDLLDITRNLALFATRYSYDLTNQLFIEKCSNRSSNVSSSVAGGSMLSSYVASSSSGQSLNVLQFKHVAQSIQTHGYGLLDSAINCTYQALKRLVNLFSRQISDERLRASLQKEQQQFQRVQRPSMSFEKATRIAKQFRLNAATLADSNAGQHQTAIDLDSIRQTVTQLGNLLALIRLIKSGALNCASKSVDYLPELDDLSNLRLANCAAEEFSQFKLQAPLVEAAQNLDLCLSDFQANFSPTTDYLKMIVELFTSLLSEGRPQSERSPRQEPNEANKDTEPSADGPSGAVQQSEASRSGAANETGGRDHLKLFFLLIPALVINYIDYLINCKERASSRSSVARFGALLSDDGFAIGTAFLLTVLGQTRQHNRLDWLGQTCAKLREDIGEIVARSRDCKYEEALRQTSGMTLRRLNGLLAEYAGLNQSLNCALLLFASSGLLQ